MMGDVRHPETAATSVQLAAAGHLVVAVVRVSSSASGLRRLIESGVDAQAVADVSLVSFGRRLLDGFHSRLAVCEKLVVSDSIRDLIEDDASSVEIGRQAEREGMRTLREAALELVAAGETSLESALNNTPSIN